MSLLRFSAQTRPQPAGRESSRQRSSDRGLSRYTAIVLILMVAAAACSADATTTSLRLDMSQEGTLPENSGQEAFGQDARIEASPPAASDDEFGELSNLPEVDPSDADSSEQAQGEADCPSGDLGDGGDDEVPLAQVIVVIDEVPAGTAIGELLTTRISMLEARMMPANLLCPSSISTLIELQKYVGWTVADDLESGTVLDARLFTQGES